MTNNQFLLHWKEVNNMAKPNCSLDFHLCYSAILIFHLFLQKIRIQNILISCEVQMKSLEK